MTRLLGIETEYGLYVADVDPAKLAEQTTAVIDALTLPHVAAWDYGAEDPRADMRGFRVDKLAQDPKDVEYQKRCPTPPGPRDDRVLGNGARLYNDHGHPEYATPECSTLRELVAHDKAGERVLLACVKARALQLGKEIALYKNNVDYHGMSYGCHENYLVRREVPFDRLREGLLPFLATRIVFAGAGKVGCDGPKRDPAVTFQLSQRADFFTAEASVDTLANRPLLNTRDEPHADPARFRRLHIICGDANLSEFATALKVGTTALVLELIERGWRPAVALADPVAAARSISRDSAWRWEVELAGGGVSSAVEVQRAYWEACRAELRGLSADADWTLEHWGAVLDTLAGDPLALGDRLDWPAKFLLLREYLEAEGLTWADPALQSLDLEYHNVDPARGLYYALEQAGEMLRVVGEEEIARAMREPPATTRALVRGMVVARLAPLVRSICWSKIRLCRGEHDHWVLDLRKMTDGLPREARERLSEALSVEEIAAALGEARRERE